MQIERTAPTIKKPSNRGLSLLPVIIFSLLGMLFGLSLFYGNSGKIPSALILKPAPSFQLPALEGLNASGKSVPGFSDAELRNGKVTLVNFFASWCPPCREEHPQLLALAKDSRIHLFGINYKDEPENARRFLASEGNPYAAIGTDRKGTAAIDWGFYGAPETFIIKGDGRILYKHIGAITPEILARVILPQIEVALK